MAILFGQQVDLQRLQALNLVFHSSVNSSPPSTPVEGQPWYVTDVDVLRIYTGATWNTLVVGPASSTSGRVPSWNGTSGGALNDGYDIVTTIGGTGVDTALPTEQAVREAIAAAIASEVSFKGGYNASTNTPDLDVSPSGVKQGDMYYVSVAGTFFATPLEAGDVIIANIDDADAESEWTMIQKNLPSIIPVAQGGTGLGTLTQYALLVGAGTGNVQFITADATANKHLKNVSATANPVWSTSSFAEASAAGRILRASGANAWAESTISIVDAFAQGGIPHASTANTLTSLAISATAGTFLRSTGTLPAWSTLVLPNAAAGAGYIMRASAANTIAMSTATYPGGATNTGAFMRVSGANVWSESTLILPNASTRGDILRGATTANNISVLALGTAGKLLRSNGSDPTWTTLTMPDTIAQYALFASNAANILTAVVVTAGQSVRLNSGGSAWEAYTPSSGGTTPHDFLDSTVHSDTVTQTVSRGSLIYGNATPAWDELAIQASGASGYVLATDATDVGWKKQRYVEKLSTSATSYDIVHNLGTRRVMVLCQDTTNNQNIFIDWNCKASAENTTITVHFGTAPTANTRIITVFGINYGAALDTAN